MSSTVIHKLCSTCGKTAETEKEKVVLNKVIRKLKCGHFEIGPYVDATESASVYEQIVSSDGRRLYPFQIEGVQFAERAQFRMLFEDEPGLGKTPQLCSVIRLHQDELLPCLVVCKAKLRIQIAREFIRWADLPAEIMQGGNDVPTIHKKAVVIVSYDSVWRMKWKDSTWAKFKTIILDECQHMKNVSSKRTKKIREIGQSDTIKHVIGASGTPTKNNAKEFFPFLNMCRPDLFPTETGYVLRFVDTYEKNGYRKYGGINRDALDRWNEVTGSFIIRRKREDVLAELPLVDRQLRNCDLAAEVEEAYNETTREYLDIYDDGNPVAFQKYQNLLAKIAIMRHLVALSKVDDTLEEVDELLLGTNEKVVIFAHHIDVQEIMMRKLIARCDEGGFPEPVWLKGGMQDELSQGVIDTFVKGPSRVMVASTLAAGEGVDKLQEVCSYCIIHERQWNPANEEQAEGRLTRIGSYISGTGKKILSKYMIAVGTIDEWLTALVDSKRGYNASTHDGKAVDFDESSLTREMMDIIAREGKKRFNLR